MTGGQARRFHNSRILPPLSHRGHILRLHIPHLQQAPHIPAHLITRLILRLLLPLLPIPRQVVILIQPHPERVMAHQSIQRRVMYIQLQVQDILIQLQAAEAILTQRQVAITTRHRQKVVTLTQHHRVTQPHHTERPNTPLRHTAHQRTTLRLILIRLRYRVRHPNKTYCKEFGTALQAYSDANSASRNLFQ